MSTKIEDFTVDNSAWR